MQHEPMLQFIDKSVASHNVVMFCLIRGSSTRLYESSSHCVSVRLYWVQLMIIFINLARFKYNTNIQSFGCLKSTSLYLENIKKLIVFSEFRVQQVFRKFEKWPFQENLLVLSRIGRVVLAIYNATMIRRLETAASGCCSNWAYFFAL